ncbi:hypothetical protein ACFC0K_40400 [Streptomyces hydrogenans]|uniref:hypothetical protein n=1 Tax=Streptomyces hydrogenans TaxID=1873719 RepID=UPI0035DB7FA6
MKPRRVASTLAASLLVPVLASCDDGTRATTGRGRRSSSTSRSTLDRDRLWAKAFAYDANGKITAVGAESDVRAKAGSGAKVIDARGNMMLPGFQNTHLPLPKAGSLFQPHAVAW